MIMKSIFKLSIAAIFIASVAACSSSDDDGGGGGTDTGTGVDTGTDTGTGTGSETGVLPVILDRMGRPGISTALIAEDDVKDDYNLAGDPAEWSDSFTDAIVSRLTIIDGLDGEQGNALLGAPTTLAGILVDDRLQIDTSEADCNTYLALEIGLQGGGCGGRTLERDVIDDTLRHLVSQANPVSDLAGNDNTFQTVWPFLGVANSN